MSAKYPITLQSVTGDADTSINTVKCPDFRDE
jgi:hypothetical protein